MVPRRRLRTLRQRRVPGVRRPCPRSDSPRRVSEALCALDRIDEIPELTVGADPDAETPGERLGALVHLGNVGGVALPRGEHVHPPVRRDAERLPRLQGEALGGLRQDGRAGADRRPRSHSQSTSHRRLPRDPAYRAYHAV